MAVTTAAHEGVSADQARPAATVLNASQQVGGALGLAVFSAIAMARTVISSQAKRRLRRR